MKNFANQIFATVILLIEICFTASGQSWSTVGTGMNDPGGRVESMCVYNGELYVGGYFDNMGGLQVNSLAKWNGSSWDSVPGMTSFGDLEIFDMAVYNNELVIVGNQIHKWNGSTWSIVGGVVDNRQFAIEVYNNELYITGGFRNAGGIPTGGIARWNGTAWNSVGGLGSNQSSGFSGYALQTYKGELYLAGGFSLIDSLPVHSIARWNGTVWDSIGVLNSTGASVFSLCEYNNKLYAGGYFIINNAPSVHWISTWDSSVWDSVGFGLKNIPRVLTVYNSELYAAGQFDTAGTIQAFGIARWNDSQWNSVGTGLDLYHINQDTIIWADTSYYTREHIYTMITYNNELYVGGKFTMIGGVSVNSIAKWHVIGASINEANNSLAVSIYPNPAFDYLSLTLPTEIPKTEIKIYNMLGEMESSSTTDKQTTNINVSAMTSGIHIIQIATDDKVIRKKFIKQ